LRDERHPRKQERLRAIFLALYLSAHLRDVLTWVNLKTDKKEKMYIISLAAAAFMVPAD
jgi:hypothetical protein